MQILFLVAVLNQGATLPPVRDPAFAADGRLAVSFEGDLWLRDAGGRRWTRLTSGAAWDRQPAWSTDGQAIVFVSDRSGGDNVWTMSLDGKDTTQVTKGNNNLYQSPEWTPDGKYIIAPSIFADKLLIIEVANGNELRVPYSGLSGRMTSAVVRP